MKPYYQDDSVTLYHGDCLKVLKEFEDKSFDYGFTSPPYNRKRNDKYTHFNDVNSDWIQLNIDTIKELLRITKNHVFYNIQTNCYNRQDVYKIIGLFSESIVDIHIWEKSNPMPSSGKSITNAVEFFIVLGTESLKSNSQYTKNIITTSVNSEMPKEHKAVMHQSVAEHFIGSYTKQGDTIIDPFGGTGTTGRVAKDNGRKCVLIELENEYCQMIVKRMQQEVLDLQ